jgi:hypothetical protein
VANVSYGLRWRTSALIEAIEAQMEELADLPTRVRRNIWSGLGGGREGRGVVLSGFDNLDYPEIDEYARVVAAAAYETGGVWDIGINYHANPSGCQDCGHANWEGEKVSCGWEITPQESKTAHPYGGAPSYEKRLKDAIRAERHLAFTHPPAFLAYCESKGATDDTGHIDTELIYRQCPKCDPIDDED